MFTRRTTSWIILVGVLAFGLYHFASKPQPETLGVASSQHGKAETERLQLTRAAGQPLTPSSAVPESVSPNPSAKDVATILNRIDGDGDEAAVELLSLAQTLQGEARREAVLQGTLLLAEKDYRAALPFLLDEALQSPAREMVLNDLEGRSLYTQLPVYLELAQKPSNPLQSRALESLQNALSMDLGQDWSAWQTAIEKHLSELSDEPSR